MTYCDAADLALHRYLGLLITEPNQFAGTCLYTSGVCELGGSALTIDAIYKRWQALGDMAFEDYDLLSIAIELGKFIVSMRRPGGGFFHAFDPHFAGTADPNYYVIYFPGESLLALTELYEMTGNEIWLTQAREVNAYMITQPVTEDHWHAYALRNLARLDSLSEADLDYAREIATTVVDGEVRSLNPKNSSISTATKIEALAAIAQALYISGNQGHDQSMDLNLRTLITFVRARQLPDNNCNWQVTDDMKSRYAGGIYSTCDDPSIRVDGPQHYINGVTAYLEYQVMSGNQ